MPKLPVCKAVVVVRTLKRAGFVENRQSGSHLILTHPVSHISVTVPMHNGRDLPRGTLAAIIKQAGLTPPQFLKLFRK